MNPEAPLEAGFYKTTRFNERDGFLRQAGLYCEEFLHPDEYGMVLRRLAGGRGMPCQDFQGVAVVPAEAVTNDPRHKGKLALYMQIKGRAESPRRRNSSDLSSIVGGG